MPSAHSSAVAYIATYTLMSAASGQLAVELSDCRILAPAGVVLGPRLWQVSSWLIALVVWAVALSVCWSRHHFSE